MAVWEFITCFQASHSHKLSRLTYICPNLCPTSSAASRLSVYAALIPVMTHLTCSLICRMTYRQALDTRFPSSNISAKTRSVHSSSRVVSSQTSLGGRLLQAVFHPSPTNDDDVRGIFVGCFRQPSSAYHSAGTVVCWEFICGS